MKHRSDRSGLSASLEASPESESTIDFNTVRYTPGHQGSGRGRTKRRWRSATGRFLRGPVSLVWLMTAARLRTRGLHLAVALAYLAGINKRSDCIKLSYSLLEEFGLDRHAAYRALNDMSEAGLITVLERRPGRSPVVSLRFEPVSTHDEARSP